MAEYTVFQGLQTSCFLLRFFSNDMFVYFITRVISYETGLKLLFEPECKI